MFSDDTNFGSVSIEFLNYALALFTYAVRYPSVFWNTNKCFGVLFSLQLIINSVQCLLMHAGVCILYKVRLSRIKCKYFSILREHVPVIIGAGLE